MGKLQIVADIMGRTEVETKCRQDTLQFSPLGEPQTDNCSVPYSSGLPDLSNRSNDFPNFWSRVRYC